MNLTAYVHNTMGGFARYIQQELEVAPMRDYVVPRIVNGPRIVNVALQLNPRLFSKLVKIETELSMAMGLAAEQKIRVSRGAGTEVRLEIPKPKGLCFSITDEQIPPHGMYSLVSAIGVDLELRPITIDFKDPLNCHVLIAGVTGSGKTQLQKMLVLGIAKTSTSAEAQFCIIDVAKEGLHWEDFAGREHMMHPVVTKEEDAVRMVQWVLAELKRRASRKEVPPKVPHLFLVIDEFADLAESQYNDQLDRMIGKIAKLGREYGVHLCFSTQYPLVANTGGSVTKRQFQVRLVGKLDDGLAAKTAAGIDNSGAQYLTHSGDFILVTNGKPIRFQAALPKNFARIPTNGGDKALELPVLESEEGPKTGRPRDELDLRILAQLLAKGASLGSFNVKRTSTTIGGWVNPRISGDKARRHWEAAVEMSDILSELGVSLAVS